MWCRSVTKQLSALVDGELPPTQEQAVRGHVEQCARCSEEVARLQSVVQLTRGIPMEAVPAGLYSRTMTRLAYADQAPVAVIPARRRSAVLSLWMWPTLAGAAGA